MAVVEVGHGVERRQGMTRLEAVMSLRRFIGTGQLRVMTDCCRGEEGDWFRGKMGELAELVETMPKTYEQDGKGDEAVVYLHYFTGQWDWYVTERDVEPAQHQAFGLACGWNDELGYISIVEIIRHGAEIDLHWTPKTLAEIKEKAAVAA